MEERGTNKKGMNLLDLPQDCISHILSLTSPLYALRSSTVCKAFNSVVQSDLVWEKFLPPDLYRRIQQSSASSDLRSKKDIVLQLCRSYIPSDTGNRTYSLDKWTGKKSFMLGPRELRIESSEDPQYWRWITLPESRFPEVAELVGAHQFFVSGAIRPRILLEPYTTYRIYFSFSLAADSRGFDAYPVSVLMQGMDCRGLFLGGDHLNIGKSFYLKPPESNDMLEDEDVFEAPRASGQRWIKIDMGKYYNLLGVRSAPDVIVMTVMSPINDDSYRSGLIVHGIELVPID